MGDRDRIGRHGPGRPRRSVPHRVRERPRRDHDLVGPERLDSMAERTERTVVAELARGIEILRPERLEGVLEPSRAACAVASQTFTGPLTAACPVSTGLAGTHTKYSRRPRVDAPELVEQLAGHGCRWPAPGHGGPARSRPGPRRRSVEDELLRRTARARRPRTAGSASAGSGRCRSEPSGAARRGCRARSGSTDGKSHILTFSVESSTACAAGSGRSRSAGRRTG